MGLGCQGRAVSPQRSTVGCTREVEQWGAQERWSNGVHKRGGAMGRTREVEQWGAQERWSNGAHKRGGAMGRQGSGALEKAGSTC
jgi:hypothetical protein